MELFHGQVSKTKAFLSLPMIIQGDELFQPSENLWQWRSNLAGKQLTLSGKKSCLSLICLD